jgi:hypothetical protein
MRVSELLVPQRNTDLCAGRIKCPSPPEGSH